jgi:2,4-dichlorophenol 6-monooxygenase
MWSGTSDDAPRRAAILRAMRLQSMEFSELNVEYGYAYDSAAVVPDGSTVPVPIDDVRVYEPSTRPGSPLPHAWIDDDEGNRRAIRDLVQPGRFLLIAGEHGDAWCAAARELADAANVPVDAVRIGHVDGDLFDPRCTWARYRGIDASGAVLVRPDRFVAWRSLSASTDPRAELERAFTELLARAVGAVAPA